MTEFVENLNFMEDNIENENIQIDENILNNNNNNESSIKGEKI